MTAWQLVKSSAAVRAALVVGMIVRLPLATFPPVMTVFCVWHLDTSYAKAGVALALYAAATAVSSPWRGRLLDRFGIAWPSAILLAISAASCLALSTSNYVVTLAVCVVFGLTNVPLWVIVQHVIVQSTSEEDRATVLLLDSALLELSFAAGPLVGLTAAAWWGAPWALIGTLGIYIAVSLGLIIWNPTVTAEESSTTTGGPRVALSVAIAVALVLGCTSTFVITGTDLGLIAAVSSMDAKHLVGVLAATWAVGSLAGGLLFSALPWKPPTWVLFLGLGAVTAPVGLAPTVPWLAAAMVVCGLFCAPTLARVTHIVTLIAPRASHGEALGWLAAATGTGAALSTPLVGMIIDASGTRSAFIVLGVVLAVSAILALVARSRLPAL